MRIYTRGGDKGTTSLIYGRRIRKDAARVNAYGTVDEVNSAIGQGVALLPALSSYNDIRNMCERVQRDLFDIGRDLATPDDKRDAFYVTDEDVLLLEKMIDLLDAENAPLTRFVLPGGHPSSAAFHVARTTARRCERVIVSLQETETVQPVIQKYLNRLSDFLFVLARTVNTRTGTLEPGVDFNSEKTNPLLTGENHESS